jgi:hypothetical protein
VDALEAAFHSRIPYPWQQARSPRAKKTA